MEKRQERRRKFHESLLNMLYAHSPPPPPPPHPDQVSEESDPPDILRLGHHIPDELVEEKSSSSSPSDLGEGELGINQKLTRAQRKQLRKKKLKQAASHRRQIIGPELPTTSTTPPPNSSMDAGDGLSEHQCPGVRQNDPQGIESEVDHLSRPSGDPSSCISQNKRKQRRVSKKLAMKKLKPPATRNCHQGPTLSNNSNEA